MAFRLTYNDVKLANVVTRDFTQSVEYDESETDVLFHRFRLRVEGILHLPEGFFNADTFPGPFAVGPNFANQASAAAVLREVRKRMGTARKALVFTDDNGNELLKVQPATASGGDVDRDVDNGPKPGDFEVLQFYGSHAFKIGWTVNCAKTACENQNRLVLSNRWTLREEMDDNHMISRYINGRIVLSKGPDEAYGHAFRSLVVPALEDGFRRAHVSYEVTRDGLSADYTVIDRQTHTAAPWPAVRMQGTHAESTSEGTAFFSDFQVMLTGKPDADKRQLIQRAIQIADDRLNFRARQFNIDYLIVNAAIIDHFGDLPAIEMRMRLQAVADDAKGTLYLANLKNRIGTPIDVPSISGEPDAYDPKRSVVPELFGSTPHGGKRDPAFLFLLHVYLQEPCDENHSIASAGRSRPAGVAADTPGRRQTTVEGRTVSDLDDGNDSFYSEETKKAVYTMAVIRNHYSLKPIRAQLPVAQHLNVSSAATSDIIGIAKPQAVRKITYSAERVGEWPKAPAPLDRYVDKAIVGVLMDHYVEPEPPRPGPDGRQPIYRITAFYEYALSRPPTTSESVSLGKLPFTNIPAAERSVSGNQLYSTDVGP